MGKYFQQKGFLNNVAFKRCLQTYCGCFPEEKEYIYWQDFNLWCTVYMKSESNN